MMGWGFMGTGGLAMILVWSIAYSSPLGRRLASSCSSRRRLTATNGRLRPDAWSHHG